MENFKAKLYTLWCWAGCGLSTAFWATVSVLVSLFSKSGRLQHFCMRRWSRYNLWLSRARVEIEGLEHIDRSQPQLLIANHSGLHDILSLAAHLPIQFRWVAKKSLFRPRYFFVIFGQPIWLGAGFWLYIFQALCRKPRSVFQFGYGVGSQN